MNLFFNRKKGEFFFKYHENSFSINTQWKPHKHHRIMEDFITFERSKDI